MISLKEALLNRPKNIDVARMATEEYINTNYNVKGKLIFETVDGVCIVNCTGDVEVKNKEIEKLTDRFKWEEAKGRFTCNNYSSLKSLKSVPEKVKGEFDCA